MAVMNTNTDPTPGPVIYLNPQQVLSMTFPVQQQVHFLCQINLHLNMNPFLNIQAKRGSYICSERK